MGACQSSRRSADVLPQTGKQVHFKKNKFADPRRSKRTKLKIQEYDGGNPPVFSPSGTRETITVSPSSSLPSSRFSADTAVDTRTCEQNRQLYEQSKKPLISHPTFNENNEIELPTSYDNINYETQSTSAVSSSVVDQFQKLKLQVQHANDSNRRRKRREKHESRKEMVNEYHHLWQEYKEIQNRVNCQNNGEGIPESISFLKDSDAWYIDFHSIHHQQQGPSNTMDISRSGVANLSLLSQASIEAQKNFFKKKSIERKQRRKRKGTLKSMGAPKENQSISSQFAGIRSGQENALREKRMKADSTIRYVDANDYNVPCRNRSSSTTQHAESYLHQTLSYPESGEAAAPSSITLDQKFPRRRNQDFPSIRRLDYDLRENESSCRRSKQSGDSFNPIFEMSKEQFLMMCSPKSGITDESSTVYNRAQAAKKYEEVPRISDRFTDNAIWNTSNDRLPRMKMSSPEPISQHVTKSENYEKGNDEIAAEKVHTRPQVISNKMKPASDIDFMSKADFLRMSVFRKSAALPDPLSISSLPDHVPMTVGDPTFHDSQVMSKISCEDTFMSPSGNQETIEEAAEESPELSTSTEDDEEEDCYAWDGHMDDEDFWDMDVRRQSLDHIDELASQVSSQISTLLSKFREDNNSIQTRSVKL